MEYFYNFDKLKYLKQKESNQCALCLIAEGSDEIIDLTVYRDELFLVSVNLYPYNPGHLMIFPHRHLGDIRGLSVEESSRLAALEKHFIQILDEVYRPQGFNLGYNMGRDAGGSIEHLHFHLIPRYRGEVGIADIIAGKRMLVEPPNRTRDRVSEQLREHPFP